MNLKIFLYAFFLFIIKIYLFKINQVTSREYEPRIFKLKISTKLLKQFHIYNFSYFLEESTY